MAFTRRDFLSAVILGSTSSIIEGEKTPRKISKYMGTGNSDDLALFHYHILDNKIPLKEQIIKPKTVYVVKNVYDLHNDSIEMPDNCVLLFEGGLFQNGTIVGNNTIIEAMSVIIFDSVNIRGDWCVEHIYSNWFTNSNNTDVIRNVFNLSNESIYNEVIINDNGIWTITIPADDTYGIAIKANTTVKLSGTIKCNTKKSGGFTALYINSDNVKILGCGKGTIVGNRDEVKGGSQTGHLIHLDGCRNVIIDGLYLNYSRGDGILIGGSTDYSLPQNVIVKNCYITHSRRQGISIGSGNNIVICNCVIDDVSGAPQGPCAGIDIENYDDGGIISKVSISNIEVRNVAIGLCLYNDSHKEGAEQTMISVSNYRALDCSKYGLRIGYIPSMISIENSVFSANSRCISIFAMYDDNHDYDWERLQHNYSIKNCFFSTNQADPKCDIEVRISGFVFVNCMFDCKGSMYIYETADTTFDNCDIRTNKITLNSKCNFSKNRMVVLHYIDSKGGIFSYNEFTTNGIICRGDTLLSGNNIKCYSSSNKQDLITVHNGNNIIVGNNIKGNESGNGITSRSIFNLISSNNVISDNIISEYNVEIPISRTTDKLVNIIQNNIGLIR